ncbi:hypothetical protein [Nostoc sp. TCL26-01]|uniref:hypothetical protein n=1 Tax=Nostoc sp. TCL26-01 TaxID=2576904 RepID=UPI0015BA8EA9|nr:hypothetical protein [Nostoc sp. TCL26-01]
MRYKIISQGVEAIHVAESLSQGIAPTDVPHMNENRYIYFRLYLLWDFRELVLVFGF